MKIFILLKARLKGSLFTRSYIKELYERDRLWVLPVAGAGVLAGAGLFIFMLYQNYMGIYSTGLNMNEPQLVFLFSGIISGLLLFLFGTPLCLSNIFYSKDNRLTSYLPVSKIEIILSRVLLVYLFMLPLHLALTIPAAAIYFPSFSSPGAWINLIIVCITGPFVPLAAAVLAASLLASIGKFSGKRTLFEFAGMLAGIAFIAFLQLSFSKSLLNGGDFSSAAAVLSGYAAVLSKIFFAADWSSKGFARGGGAWILLSTAFTAVSVFLASLLIRLLNPGINEISEHKTVKKQRTEKTEKIRLKPTPVTRALLKREWMVVKSNSAFLFEIAGEVIILPIILAAGYFAVPGELSAMINETAADFPFIPLAVLGILILISSINSVSCTSLSREGKTFSISKVIPVSGSGQVKAKMLFHMLLFVSSWILNLIILMLFLKIPPLHMVYLIPAGPAVIFLGFIISINIDLARPVLNWSHPQQAMKQNMNVLIGLGLGLLSSAAVIIPAAGIYLLSSSAVLSGVICTILVITADIIFFPRLIKYSDRRYIEIST